MCSASCHKREWPGHQRKLLYLLIPKSKNHQQAFQKTNATTWKTYSLKQNPPKNDPENPLLFVKGTNKKTGFGKKSPSGLCREAIGPNKAPVELSFGCSLFGAVESWAAWLFSHTCHGMRAGLSGGQVSILRPMGQLLTDPKVIEKSACDKRHTKKNGFQQTCFEGFHKKKSDRPFR